MNENLITKKINQLKEYNKPNMQMIQFSAKDVLHASGVGEEIYVGYNENYKPTKIKKEEKNKTIKEKYPNGLPLEVLEQIDYKKFGTLLKQNKLLPPSYDRNPADVSIVLVGDIPRLKLTFKSKTSESYRIIAVYRYDVSCAKNNMTAYYTNLLMQEQWRKFAEYVMDYWGSSFRFTVMKKDL